jgi:hypothetical protein
MTPIRQLATAQISATMMINVNSTERVHRPFVVETPAIG